MLLKTAAPRLPAWLPARRWDKRQHQGAKLTLRGERSGRFGFSTGLVPELFLTGGDRCQRRPGPETANKTVLRGRAPAVMSSAAGCLLAVDEKVRSVAWVVMWKGYVLEQPAPRQLLAAELPGAALNYVFSCVFLISACRRGICCLLLFLSLATASVAPR